MVGPLNWSYIDLWDLGEKVRREGGEGKFWWFFCIDYRHYDINSSCHI